MKVVKDHWFRFVCGMRRDTWISAPRKAVVALETQNPRVLFVGEGVGRRPGARMGRVLRYATYWE